MKTSTTMIEWQYKSVLKELQLLQDHASSPDCPCALSDLGEYCLPKHALSIAGYAEETAVMDSAHAKLWYELQESAMEKHENLKAGVCGKGKDEDVAGWSREWRKRIERIYYSCKVQPKAHLKRESQKVYVSELEKGDKFLHDNFEWELVHKMSLCNQGEAFTCRPSHLPKTEVCKCLHASTEVRKPKVHLKSQGEPAKETGFVICTDGKKLVAGPVAEGTADRVVVPTSCPSKMKPLAVYHSHVSGEPIPSQEDIEEVAKMKIPMVCVEARGEAKCYGVQREGVEMKGNPVGKIEKEGEELLYETEQNEYILRYQPEPYCCDTYLEHKRIRTDCFRVEKEARDYCKFRYETYALGSPDTGKDNPIAGGVEMSKTKPSCKLVKNYYHCRIKPKQHFDPQSFRTVSPKEGVRITIGCPKGRFDKEKQVCKVGTESQKILYRKDVYK